MKSMKTKTRVGISGYGAYVPMYRIKGEEIRRVWGGKSPIPQKSVPGPDEDTVTFSIEAGRNALNRSSVDRDDVHAVLIGSESQAYAVKSDGTIVAEALGLSHDMSAANLEFACKAGTEAMQMCIGFVASGMMKAAMAIGADTSQGRPADPLEFTAGAGAGAFIFSEEDKNSLASVDLSYSYVTDTPDFWRRQGEKYPSHAGRFTGEPAYFKHVLTAARTILEDSGLEPREFAHAVFHQPNPGFVRKAAKKLGFTEDQIKHGLLTPRVGNCYAGAVPLALTNVLDHSSPGEKILVASFGSGAGSDSFVLTVKECIEKAKDLAPRTEFYVNREKFVDYAFYARYRRKIIR